MLIAITSTKPTVWDGVTACKVAWSTTTTVDDGTPPNETETPVLKLLPLILTDVPPAVGPDVGLMLNMDGAAGAAELEQPASDCSCPEQERKACQEGP